jgi:membrane-bound lytic murein transglycosylase B
MLIVLLVVAIVAGAALVLLTGATAAHRGRRPAGARDVTAANIPAPYLSIYRRVAAEYGLDWAILAAVGEIESDHGRSPLGGIVSGANPSGAEGPAQFLAGTWARYGVDADGRGGASPYDPQDAIMAMAAYLKASGAPENWPQALYAYNHSTAYVQAVLGLADTLRVGGIGVRHV